MRPEYESERRFLVADPGFLRHVSAGSVIVQGYLFSVDGYVIRVRRTHKPVAAGRELQEGPAILAAKGPRVNGRREEYESEIPVPYAAELIKRARAKVSKTRHRVVDAGRTWDVDVFHGENDGLVIAECEGVELDAIHVPSWCGREITDDRRFDNETLALRPYLSWPEHT